MRRKKEIMINDEISNKSTDYATSVKELANLLKSKKDSFLKLDLVKRKHNLIYSEIKLIEKKILDIDVDKRINICDYLYNYHILITKNMINICNMDKCSFEYMDSINWNIEQEKITNQSFNKYNIIDYSKFIFVKYLSAKSLGKVLVELQNKYCSDKTKDYNFRRIVELNTKISNKMLLEESLKDRLVILLLSDKIPKLNMNMHDNINKFTHYLKEFLNIEPLNYIWNFFEPNISNKIIIERIFTMIINSNLIWKYYDENDVPFYDTSPNFAVALLQILVDYNVITHLKKGEEIRRIINIFPFIQESTIHDYIYKKGKKAIVEKAKKGIQPLFESLICDIHNDNV